MSSNKKNDDELTSRIINLDFLRGLFIILALDQHFTYYINMWYVEYFRDSVAITSTYAVHFPMIGKQIPTDIYNHFLAVVFTPWVSQIYLTMAAFNLARRSRTVFSADIGLKFKIFALIFIYFLIENLIVAPNVGQGISFYPIMLWMLVLGLISLLYHFLGIKGVIILTVLSLFRFVIPMNEISDSFEMLIRTNLHPSFEYDARFEYFIFSGCLGFIMGYVHYHMPDYRHNKDLLFSLMGLALVGIYIAIGDSFSVDVSDVFSTEHDLARTFSGTAYVLGVQAVVISAFLWLEKKNIKFNIPIFIWVGVNSLFIFALHRILFVKIIAPLSVLSGSLTGRVLGASIIEAFVYVFITLGMCYFIKKSRMFEIVFQQK
jgi:hypothetical protein